VTSLERRKLETIIYEKEDAVARIILNRPDKANTQNSAMVHEFDGCLHDAEADYGIKVVLLKAIGRGFSAGHDVVVVGGQNDPLPEFTAADEAGHPWKGQADLFLWPMLHLWEFQKPTVAAVHGYCIGAGTYFACLPDIVVAADDAEFQMPLVQGLGFPGGETMMEPWLFMNFHRTYEYLYLSKTVDAYEAESLGMVNQVVPREELDETAELIAAQIAEAPLSTLMATKSLVKQAWEQMGLRVHWQASTQLMELVGRAGDVAEWRRENAARGYGSPRNVAKARAEAAARIRARATTDPNSPGRPSGRTETVS
jgi:enoyl-CoA hydratase